VVGNVSHSIKGTAYTATSNHSYQQYCWPSFCQLGVIPPLWEHTAQHAAFSHLSISVHQLLGVTHGNLLKVVCQRRADHLRLVTARRVCHSMNSAPELACSTQTAACVLHHHLAIQGDTWSTPGLVMS